MRALRLSARLASGLAVAALGGCQDNQTPVEAAPDAAPLACLPDLDGVLRADELPIAPGVEASYYQSPPGATRAIDLAGEGGGAERRWTLDQEVPDDEIVAVAPALLDDQWYAGAFPGATFVTAEGALDAVYHLDAQGLWLHGVASRDEAPAAGATVLAYDAPIPVVRLPLVVGDAWQAEGTVSDGLLDGLPYRGTDAYDAVADAGGELRLPYVDFAPVIRVSTHVVVTPATGGQATSRRIASFLFECFGEIAHAESRPDEAEVEFTTATSLRRFAL